jgi:hypothetical protein
MLKGTLWLAAKLSGRFKPVRLKPDPVTVAWETVIGEGPGFVRVPVCA